MRVALLPCVVAGLAVTPCPAAGQQPAGAVTQSGAPQRIAGAVLPTWTTMEGVIRSTWAERYARETVVAVERIGEPKYIDEPGKIDMSTSTSYSSVWDWSWSSTTTTTITKGREGAFLRQDVVVTAERPNRTRARFTVAALYKLAGGQWSFAEMPVGKVEEIAGAGAPAQPSDDAAAKIFAAAWGAARQDFTVASVKVKAGEFHQSGGRYWVTYKLAIDATGTAKAPEALRDKRVVCEPADYSSVLKWDKAAGAWKADESMIGMINETSACKEP